VLHVIGGTFRSPCRALRGTPGDRYSGSQLQQCRRGGSHDPYLGLSTGNETPPISRGEVGKELVLFSHYVLILPSSA
jgi:hypothetical protein